MANAEAATLRQVRHVGVCEQAPLAAAVDLGQVELHHVLPAVEDDQQRRLVAALLDAALLRAAVEQHAEAARIRLLPLRLGHLLARGTDPGCVLDAQLLVEEAAEEALLAQDRKAVAQP